MTLANLVHGLRTEGTGCSLAPLYRSSPCRRGRPIVSEGILDAPRDDVDGRPPVGLHRHAAVRRRPAADLEDAEGNDRPAGGRYGCWATVQPPGGSPPPRGGVSIPSPAGRRRGSAGCSRCCGCCDRRRRGCDHRHRGHHRKRPCCRTRRWQRASCSFRHRRTGAKPEHLRPGCPDCRRCWRAGDR